MLPGPEPEPEPEPERTEIERCNDERDELFVTYLWDGGTELVWVEDPAGADEAQPQLVQVEREIVPDITRMLDESDPTAKVCPYVPSTRARMGKLQGFASISVDDVVLDIGCGDGRALLLLAETVGCRGVGIDIDPDLVAIAGCTARATASTPEVSSLLRYEVADMCATPSAAAAAAGAVNKLDEIFEAHGVTVVLIYLIADALVLLYPHLQAAITATAQRRAKARRPLVRVVTQVYHFDFGGSGSFFCPPAAVATADCDSQDTAAATYAPTAADKAWNLVMYPAEAFLAHPPVAPSAATEEAADICAPAEISKPVVAGDCSAQDTQGGPAGARLTKISEHQVLISST
jgi:SAM-dependent methyltransferase